MGYLTGTTTKNDEGVINYNRAVTFLNTLFFVLGISTVFFILGIGSFKLSKILTQYNSIFTIFGGIVIIIFGLVQLRIIKVGFLNRERSLM